MIGIDRGTLRIGFILVFLMGAGLGIGAFEGCKCIFRHVEIKLK